MASSSPRRPFAVAALLVIAAILYGSLYPFHLHEHLPAGGPLRALLRSWDRPQATRGDVIANILLYLPYGFLVALAIPERMAAGRRLALATLGGLVLSTGVEIGQFYIAGRITSLSDVYLNVLGALLGALAGTVVGAGVRWPLVRDLAAQPAPALLLTLWLALRLYPYVPVIDLHKYWYALQPVILATSPPPEVLFRRTVLWLAVCHLVEAVFGWRRMLLLFPLLAAGTFAGKILVVGNVLTAPDMVGAGLAFGLWLLALRRLPGGTALLTAALAALVLEYRLEPFRFGTPPHAFGWLPFLSFLRGSIEINIRSFLEKIFLYGGLVWLLAATGLRLSFATLLVATMLFLTSLAEMYLPGRSAELTDAVIAVAIGLLMRLLGTTPGHSPVRSGARR